MCDSIKGLLEECKEIDVLSEPRKKLILFLKAVMEEGHGARHCPRHAPPRSDHEVITNER